MEKVDSHHFTITYHCALNRSLGQLVHVAVSYLLNRIFLATKVLLVLFIDNLLKRRQGDAKLRSKGLSDPRCDAFERGQVCDEQPAPGLIRGFGSRHTENPPPM